MYDDVQKSARVNQYTDSANQTTGTAIFFPYSFNGLSFATRKYTIFNTIMLFDIISNESYTLYNNHLSSVTRGPGNVGQDPTSSRFYSYGYTGENITQGVVAQPRFILSRSVYEYDTNINPFFGLSDPDLDDRLRFSRNNIVKETISEPGLADAITVYEYEYNAQNLPTKRTKKQSGSVVEVITYSYESY